MRALDRVEKWSFASDFQQIIIKDLPMKTHNEEEMRIYHGKVL
jgi:hypothetical protein